MPTRGLVKRFLHVDSEARQFGDLALVRRDIDPWTLTLPLIKAASYVSSMSWGAGVAEKRGVRRNVPSVVGVKGLIGD